MYFVLYFSRLGGFQEESSADCADSKSSVKYLAWAEMMCGRVL